MIKRRLGAILALLTAAASAGAQPYSPSEWRQKVAWYHAPVVIQETWPDDNVFKENHLVKADFDGDIHPANNWTSAERMANGIYVGPRIPAVYYSITETDDAYYIGYYFYHVSDGGRRLCMPGGWCKVVTKPHVGDLEGYWKVVQKHPDLTPWGIEKVSLFSSHGTYVPAFNRSWYAYPGPNYYDQAGTARQTDQQVLHWRDTTATSVPGLRRPVVMIRRTSHGTYPAQDIHSSVSRDMGCGGLPCGINPHDLMEWGQDTLSYEIITHDGPTRRITYWPDPRDNCGVHGCLDLPSVPLNGTAGSYRYTLVSFVNSFLWLGRNDTRVYDEHGTPFVNEIGGTPASGTEFGRGCFVDADPEECGAQPPWEWKGGEGASCSWRWANPTDWVFFHGCSYHFGKDFNTDASDDPIDFANIGGGATLAEPHWVMSRVWRQYGWSSLYHYNPYRYDPTKGDVLPPPPAPPTLYASISGNTEYNVNYPTGVLTATYSGSYSPFVRSWYTDDGQWQEGGSTFAVTVSSGSVTAFLDVEDATGAHIVVSKFLHFCANADEGCDPYGDPYAGGGGDPGGGEDPCEPNCDWTLKSPIRRGIPAGAGPGKPSHRPATGRSEVVVRPRASRPPSGEVKPKAAAPATRGRASATSPVAARARAATPSAIRPVRRDSKAPIRRRQ